MKILSSFSFLREGEQHQHHLGRLSNFPLHGDFPPLSAHSLSMAEEAREGDISLPSPYFQRKLHNNQLILGNSNNKKRFQKAVKKAPFAPSPLQGAFTKRAFWAKFNGGGKKTRSTLLGQAIFFFRYLLKIATPFDKQIDPLKNVNNSRGCNGSCISYYFFRSKFSFSREFF